MSYGGLAQVQMDSDCGEDKPAREHWDADVDVLGDERGENTRQNPGDSKNEQQALNFFGMIMSTSFGKPRCFVLADQWGLFM